jgi:hypothetical protein
LLASSAGRCSFTFESATVSFRTLSWVPRAPSPSSRKSAVNRNFGGELRAAGSALRFVSMRDLQVKRLKSEDPWQQS